MNSKVIHNFSKRVVVSENFVKSVRSHVIDIPEKPPDMPVVELKIDECPIVYRMGDEAIRRVLMSNVGLDIGTKNIVLAFRADDKIQYISEINGYWEFERATKFIKNMLSDPNKVRSDGTKRPARWIELDGKVIVLGKDAEELAYAKNDTLCRPMAEGGISQDEQAMTVLASIIHGLLETAEKDVGNFGKELKLVYCTTAPAINKSSNIDYHRRVVDLIIDGYETKAKLFKDHVKESHAIVLAMDEKYGSGEGTGVGISWGAGTVTVSYIMMGVEVYSFCYVGAGDWIDENVAQRHGYDPLRPKAMKKVARETPTTVARRKMDIDLTPGKEPEDRVGLDIVLHYDVLISKVIDGIVEGFLNNESEARIDKPINFFMAGGTASPPGFADRVSVQLSKHDLPFEIDGVFVDDNPLYTVASGCLIASEIF